MTTHKMPVWSPSELHHKLDEGERFAILDVRNRDEFDVWRIEGKRPIPTVNLPYFDLLELESEDEEIAAAVARAAPEQRHLGGYTPLGTVEYRTEDGVP